MKALILDRNIMKVWLAIFAVSSVSWLLSNFSMELGSFSDKHLSQLLVVLGFLKIWMIVHHFMEIKHAPRYLKIFCEGWVALSCISILSIFYIL